MVRLHLTTKQAKKGEPKINKQEINQQIYQFPNINSSQCVGDRKDVFSLADTGQHAAIYFITVPRLLGKRLILHVLVQRRCPILHDLSMNYCPLARVHGRGQRIISIPLFLKQHEGQLHSDPSFKFYSLDRRTQDCSACFSSSTLLPDLTSEQPAEICKKSSLSGFAVILRMLTTMLRLTFGTRGFSTLCYVCTNTKALLL